MNKYEKQFKDMLMDQLDPNEYDKQCSTEKCMGCSAQGCPYKQKLQNEYILQLICEKAGLSEDERRALICGLENKDPEVLDMIKQIMEEIDG